MENMIKEFYVVRCNQIDNRYLSFRCGANKNVPILSVLDCGQSNPNDLSMAIFFRSEQDADIAKELYLDAGRVLNKNKECVSVETATINDNKLYMELEFRVSVFGKRFLGYISIKDFVDYINS